MRGLLMLFLMFPAMVFGQGWIDRKVDPNDMGEIVSIAVMVYWVERIVRTRDTAEAAATALGLTVGEQGTLDGLVNRGERAFDPATTCGTPPRSCGGEELFVSYKDAVKTIVGAIEAGDDLKVPGIRSEAAFFAELDAWGFVAR